MNALLGLAGEEGWVVETEPPDPSDPLGPARQVRRLREAPDDALVSLDDLTTEQAQTLFGQLRDELSKTRI